MKNFTLREEIKVPQAFITEKKNGCLKKQVLFNNKIVLSRLFLLGLLILVAIPSFAQQKELPASSRATKPNIPYAPKVKENKGGLEYQTMAVAGSISVAENATYNAYTPEQLVKNLFVTGCLSASNVRFGYYSRNNNTYTWQNHTWSSTPGNRQLAYFNKATSTFPIEEGLLLTTGKASSAMGPNNTGGSTDEMVSAANDPDLASITGRRIYDAATLEFDFVPAGNTLEFKYVFSSEEYLEYCETGYNDAFGFFLSGPGISGPYRNNAINLALLPSSTTPISINTIHAAGTNVDGVNFPAVNGQYYQNNAAGSTTTQFDGNTVILTATYPVTPCSTYRIKLSIGDASDQQWDSGVFLGARSFNSENIVLTNYGNMIENQNNIFEGCNNKFRVQRTGSDISQPLVVNLLLSGTFTNGVDIQTTGGQPFPTQVTIPANQTYIDIPYTTVADAISDNSETFIVRTITSCPCSSDVVYVTQTMTIYETAVLNSINATNAQCNGQNNGTLTVNVSGGSGSYLYSINNGANWQSINTFSNLSPGNYTVVVKDPGSCKPNLSGTATIGNPTPIVANAGPDVTICPGGNTQLSGSGGVIYSWSPSTGLNFNNIANPIASPTTTTTYTLTVTNANGQCTSTDQVVVNVDSAPVAPTAASVNNNNICSNAGGNIVLSATGGSGTTLKWYTSSCGGTAIGTGNNLSVAAPTQTTTYYVRWENSCGNSACAQVTVNVKPTVTLTGPANASIQGCNQSSITPLTYSETPVSITLAQFQSAGGTTSNASLAHTITYKDTKTGSCPTVVTRVFTVATDCTTANFTQTITINDTTAPTFNGTLPTASITAACGNIPAAATLTATDACGTATVTFAETRTDGACPGSYTLTRKWTATDLCGNTAVHTQVVTVTDTQAPVFAGTLPAASITASCGNIPAAATLTATDACGSATVTFAETRTDGACAGNYTLTRKWTATDLCGNTAIHTQVVTVTDTQAPVFAGTLPSNITAACGNIPAAATLTATDACGSATVTFAETRTDGACAGSYTLTRKWTATDLCGNTAVHTQVVTVTDTQAPVFAGTLPAASITASCGNIPAAATLTATDACGSATVTFAETRTDGACAGNYTLTRKWTATDLCGNTAIHTQVVTVTDTQAPVFAGTLPSNITAACGNIPAAATLTATDACGSATVTFAETRTDGACAGSYTLTRKWTATDLCGNTAVHTQVVTVTDTQAPVFTGTLPSNITAACGNIPTAATLTATDACGSATVTFAETRTDGTCAGSYTLTRKWTATDLCGNTAVHTQIVTVTDTQAPVFTGTLPAASITASCGNIPTAATLTATDACGSATVTFAETRTDGSCAGNYTLTRKWTATDLCGNTAVHTQVVTVTDAQAPVFTGTLPSNITASCGNIPTAVTLTATDACGSATVTFAETRTDGACAGNYTLTRKWTATDLCGNTAVHTQVVTVTDTQAPTFTGTLPAASITASCGNIPTAATLTATDACGSATVTFAETRTDGACAGSYTLTRKWTATDLCGNTAVHTQTVTVTDTQAPVFSGTLPAASITASCGNIPAAATLTATDACGSATVTFAETRTDGACAGSYTLTRKWTATDLCGNTAVHTQVVTVTDTQAPVFAGTLPAASITASCGNIPTAATLTATDACGSATVTFAETRTDGACAGSYTLTRKWTATDLCGNTAVHTQTVTVTDTQAPVFSGTLPAVSITASCGNIPAAATLTATDACGSATVTFAETRTDGACAGSYTLTRKWTATDLCGNTAVHTQIVTVTDTQAPVFAGTLPAASITASCGNIPTAATLTATDACGSATVTFAETRTDGACAGSYTLTRKWTATDLCGNTTVHTQVVTVTDTQAPVFAGTLPVASITVSCGNIPTAATLTATDACGSATVTFAETRTDGTCAGNYTLTRKWTATDLCGNTAIHTQTVTVTDTQAPVFAGTLPAASITASCGNIPTAATLTATDACGSATVTFAETRTDGACAGSYTLTRKWTATDLCGNTAEHTQVVTVTDTQAPVFAGTLPAAEVAASCDSIPAAATLTATDACGTATVTFAETRTDGACAGSYTLTRKWTATDLCGNTAEHTQVVTVTDTQAPVFAGTLPAAEVAASCDSIPVAATLTATDACGSATVTFAETRTDGACAGSYTLTRKWTATDLCGNTAEHTQIVTVQDNIAPTFTGGTLPSNITASCENVPTAATLTATDACGSATVTFAETRTDGACPGSYTLTRKWTATDLCGNTAVHTQVVTVTDTQAPVFTGTLPSNITAACGNIPTAATLTATDACGTATVTFAETRTDGACAGSYTLTRKWTATDLCGNTAEHTQVVTVTDTQAPVFAGTLPAAEVAASCDSIPVAATLTATDACGSATVTFAETRTDGACAGSYTLTRKWTATDLCGNTAEHTQIVTVQDNIAPTFTGGTLPSNITASCENVPTAATLTATDACGSATVTFAETRTDGACPGSYTLTRKWTATDLCGNTAVHTQVVTVTDTQAPVFTGTLPSNITAACGNIPTAATLTATDACGTATVTFAETRTDGACAGSYTLTRKWTATDLCGNTAEHTQVVTVTDTQAPVFAGTLPAAEVAASCDSIPVAATLTATDACGSATVTFAETRTDGACAGSYTLTRKWTATDLCGNTAEHTQIVTVQDNIAPTFTGGTLPSNITAACGNIPTAATLTATDACGSATVTFAETRTDGACAGSYTLTRKWTATDLCGNTAVHTQVVTVTDTQAPVFTGTLPSNITAACGNIPTAATLTATDACGTATVTFAETRTDGACAGSYTLTRKWTATDLCGNTAEHTQVVTVTDTQAPVFAGTLPAAEVAASCDSIPVAATLTATDACGTATVTFAETRTDGACAGSYTLTRKWTATDLCGNTAEHTQVVTVTDTQAPAFDGTLPAAEVAASCDSIPVAAVLTATDACGTATVTFAETRTDGACAGSYTLTRKWTATDLCGNTAEHTQVVTVTDTQAPAFDGTLPAAEVAASCDSIPAAAVLTATDACGTATVTFAETRTDGTCAGSYTLTRKWTATDLCGNTAEHVQVVTVTDTQAPAFDGTLPAAEVAASCDSIPAAATLTATDACGTATVTFAETRTDGACAGSYTLTRKWTATDLCGNTAEHTQVVTVTDTQAPAFDGTLPAAEVAASCDSIPAAAALTATDACGSATVTFAETRTDGACAGSYTLTRKWTATDLCGNTAEHTQVVTVTDTQAPAFDGTLPAAEVAASCDSIPAAATLTATDACGTATVTFAETRTDGACAGSYTLTRKWTATDLCGNTAEHTQVVTVTDTQAPAFDGTLPAAEVAASCDSIPAAATLTATDACGTATVTFAETRTDGACAGSYTLTRKWTATDLCGNTAEHVQVVTVTDTQAPVFAGTLPAAEVAASCDSIPAAATLTATDACGTATVTFAETRTDGSCAGNYTLTRKWTATDLCGNTAEHTQVVTVTDTQAPAFDGTLPAAEVAASCDSIPAAAVLTATDVCGTATVTFAETRTDGACAGSYTLTRKWTATDLCGNTAEHTQVVTVTDNQGPTFVETVPTDIIVACGSVPTAPTLTATDNCSMATVTMLETIENGACAGDKIITRTWTAVDLCNNITSATQIITVEDNMAPTLVTPIETTINVVCSEVPEAPVLEFTDSCSSVESVIFDEQIENQTATGYTITRSWSATDSCGNSNVITQTINVTISNPTQTIASELCVEDLSIDLFTLLDNSIERTGTWIDTNNSRGLLGSIFNPANVTLGDYVLSYVIADGDCPRTIQINMNVNDDCVVLAPCEIIVHNAMTPNGDGLNEFFQIEGLDCYPNNTVEIYNRWGVLVFDAQGYDNTTKVFRGVSEGRATVKKSEELPDGTYYYVLKYVDAEGRSREKASYLYINR